jgi:hypothetical protein
MESNESNLLLSILRILNRHIHVITYGVMSVLKEAWIL